MNYFYFDSLNQKQGPVTETQLRELADHKVIGPQTPMETDTGHKGVAGQIPGLFAATDSPFAQSAQAVPVPIPSAAANVFCTNCGKPVSAQTVACMSCGAKPSGHKKFCRQCSVALTPEQVVCVKCGTAIGGKSIWSMFRR